MFVVNYCLHKTNRIYDGYEESSENCISKLDLGLNISIKLNEISMDAIVIFLAFMGRLKRLFANTACGKKYLSKKTLQTAHVGEQIPQMS